MSDDHGGPTRDHASSWLRKHAEDCRRKSARLRVLADELDALARMGDTLGLQTPAECALCGLAVQFRPNE